MLVPIIYLQVVGIPITSFVIFNPTLYKVDYNTITIDLISVERDATNQNSLVGF